MARRRNGNGRKPRKISALVIALVLLFLAAMGWRLNGLRTQLQTARFERDRYQDQVEEMERENKALSDDLEEGVTDEKIQDIARNDLGMVLPGEYVFYNAGAANG